MSDDEEEDSGKFSKKQGSLHEEESRMTFGRYCHSAMAAVTLEPMLFIKMVAESNYKVVADTLEIERVCRVNLNFSASDCAAMDDGNHTDVQTAVQKFQNIFNYHQSLIDSFVPLLIIIFAGPLSDRYGRKPAMITVLIGFILLSILYILTAAFENWPVQILYLATVLGDLGGSWVVFNMAVYSYLADITSVESRTKRMGIADAIWYLGAPVGTLLGGYIFRFSGYVAVFTISGLLWTLCLLYTIFLVPESKPDMEILGESWPVGCCGPVKYIGSLLKTTFRKRPRNGRTHLYILIGLKLGTFLVQGHQVYLWARKVLRFGPTNYSLWSSLEQSSHELGTAAWVSLAESIGLHDCTIAAGGLFSIMLWSIILSCITGPTLWWLIVVASLAGFLEGSIEPALRSMLTAVVGIGEEGRVLALLGLLESAWLSADGALYTYIYNSFLESFPQINFVVQASIAAFLIAVVLLLKKNLRKVRDIEAGNATHPHSV